jgi:uncharacterized flavoprotein (TIGR03862 family)
LVHEGNDGRGAEILDRPVVVIGAGPAGLMAAEQVARHGMAVQIFDSKPSAGRKFLVAGVGGLNLTHSEPLEAFLSRYSAQRAQLEPLLRAFGPPELRQWAAGLGFETFVGTSGRVFPMDMKAAPLLRAWLQRLKESGVVFHYRHHWLGWDKQGELLFSTPLGEQSIQAAAVLLALGGGSWPKLGSTGEWVPLLRDRGVGIAPLRPANCGFNVQWSEYFRIHYAGHPVKNVVLSFEGLQGTTFRRKGEFIVTNDGIEGSLVYTVSALLRDTLEAQGQAKIFLDLAPAWDQLELEVRLKKLWGSRSLANILEKSIRLKGVNAGLLREFAPHDDLRNPALLAGWIKCLPVPILSPRPLEEAISSAGGVQFDALDERLMIKALPGIFCAGEMLDWEAPTGGYLLTCCFATGRAAGLGLVSWLEAARS